MRTLQRLFDGTRAVGLAVVLTAAAVSPALLVRQTAYALPVGGQVTTRAIKMSDSVANATGVSYNVTFTSYTSYTVRGIVVDFCSGSETPIVGDANCNAPAAFTVGGSPSVTLNSGISGGTWVSGAASLNSGRTLVLTDSTGNAQTAGSTTIDFTINNVHNPSTTGTFYARIITYSSHNGDISTYAAGTEGSTDATDYGGIALSTASQLTVTAKVQEQLTFCVYVTGASCGAGTGTAVPLGDANGVLSSYTTNYTNTARFGVASNAQAGVTVRIKGTNLCRIPGGACADANTANIISPSTTSGSMNCVADSASSANEQFGMRVSTPGAGVTATAPFNCAASNHGFDTNSTNGTGSTYGATVASTAGPGDEVISVMEFMAKAATTTEAGIYTTNLTFIATGTY